MKPPTSRPSRSTPGNQASTPGFSVGRLAFRPTLYSRLLLTFWLVTLLPLGLLAYLNLRAMQTALTNNARQSLYAAASKTADSVDDFILASLNAVRTEAQLPALVTYLSLPPSQRANSPEEVQAMAVLHTLRRKDQVNISSYALLDLEGRKVLDTYTQDVGADRSERGYFLHPLQTGLPYISPVQFSPTTHRLSLYFSSPVRDTNGAIVGVLCVRYSAALLQELITRSTGLLGKGSFVILLDENHIRLADGSAPEMITRSVVPLDPTTAAELQAARRLPPGEAGAFATNLPDFEQALLEVERQAYFVAELHPNEYSLEQGAVVKLKQQPWLLALAQPQSIFLAAVEAQTRNSLVLVLVIALIMIGMAAGMARLLAAPILHLTEAARLVAGGNLATRAQVKGNDEIGVLATTFNAMTAQLQQTLEGLQQNVAELERTSQALRKSEENYRGIFENAVEGIYRVSFEGRLMNANPAIARLLGYDSPDDVVTHLTDVQRQLYVHPQDRDNFITAILEENFVLGKEFPFYRRDRQKIWVTINARLVRDENGAPLYIDGFLADITERKRAEEALKESEEELKKHRNHLEELVKERTAELAEAKERSEAANRAKSVFLANMSHELRTPLNAVLGFSRLMRNDPEVTPKQAESLDIIRRSGEHLLGLINNVLDISKIESGRVALEESTLDLHQLVHELRSLMHVRAEEKELSFSIEQSPDLPQYITVDAGKLRQVLLNLIGNALKYTSQGGVILRAGVAAWEAAQRARLHFEVEDTGPGIHAEDQAHIFIPFVQLANQPSGQAGTGLGLAISKQYIELMGGQIGVTSEPGKGALFRFELPVVAFPAGEVQIEPPRGQVIGLAPGQPHYRLLIAEDQPENRQLLREMLEMFAFEVYEAANGKEALAQFEQQRPDLIWMDIRMPVMDGLEATRRIKATPAGADTHIIALTAHALEEERREIIAAGCDDFIRKPYRDTDVFDALTRRLGVHFIYEDGAAPANMARQQTEAALAALPGEMLAELEHALTHLDVEAIDRTIEAIRACDVPLANELAALARDFQFSPMLHLIESGREKGREIGSERGSENEHGETNLEGAT